MALELKVHQKINETLKVICLDALNARLNDIAIKIDADEKPVFLERSSNSDARLISLQNLLDESNPSILIVMDTRLTKPAVSLACECLRSGVDTYLAYETLQPSDWLRALRIYHSGGICLGLEDLLAEFTDD